MTSEGGSLVTIRIVRLPVPLWAKTQEAVDDLLREFTLIALGDRPGDRELPRRLGALLTELSERYGPFGGNQEARLQQAADDGEEELELTYELPPSVSGAARHLGELLDEADEYCRRGRHLLTLASPPDVRAFRWWFLDEFERQVKGAPATPWPQSKWATELEGAVES